MLEFADIASPERVEQIRSVAMLPTVSPVLSRKDALLVLETLAEVLRRPPA